MKGPLETSGKRPAVFLDRDGTINEEMGYINHLSRFQLMPGVSQAIKTLNEHNLLVFVVTNQSGVARGYFDENLVRAVHKKMEQDLAGQGARIDRIYYCPHHPTIGPAEYRKACHNRKPEIGFVEQAQLEFSVDPQRSYSIGDRIKDIYFGHRFGGKAVLVLTGYGRGEYEHQRHQWKEEPDFIATDLREAIAWILKDLKIAK